MKQAKRTRITKRAVEASRQPDEGESRLWDTEVKGFCLRVYASGRRTYALKYRTRHGRQRWHSIGVHGSPWTPETARAEAKAVLAMVAQGADPGEERRQQRADLTVSELIDRYLDDGPADKPNKRVSTWKADRSNLDRHVRPLLGRRIARSVTTSDAARMASDIVAGRTAARVKTGPRGLAVVKGGSGTAQRALGTAAAMYAWATKHALVETNPFTGIRLPRRASVERFLSMAEAARLTTEIDRLAAQRRITDSHADIFRLLLLTGARRSEITRLRWAEVDLDRRRLILPPERSKAGGKLGERRIALSPQAAQLLAARARTSEFVFPSSEPSKPAYAVQKPWSLVREAAGLPDLRLHDLRHSFASFALARGASLPLIGKALGHSTSRVTERYAHLADDPLDQMVAEVGQAVARGGARKSRP